MIQANNLFKRSIIAAAILGIFACAGPSGTQESQMNTESTHISEPEASENKDSALANSSSKRAREEEVLEAIMVSGAREKSRLVRSDKIAAMNQLLAMPASVDVALPQNNTENYQHIDENPVKIAANEPLSTFSIDVDTGSYTNSRRMLTQGIMPPPDAVRIEEYINYFDYQYPAPTNIDTPFSVNTVISVAPWNEERHLLRIGLKGYVPKVDSEAARNLVFLLDVSGSMNQANKLPLLKRSLSMLSNQLNSNDRVSIVVYAGASGIVLEPTAGDKKAQIINAMDKLQAGGSTNGASGIQLAYQLAEQAFIQNGINRVILATDGDFNVGMVDQDALIDLIEQKRDKGIALTTLGFGQGNYNDYLMEQLADAGNGNYAYIDTINEARKVLVDELHSTMQIIAKDVKIQVEFNPDQVAEYRLIGYENRVLANEDFNNDKVDAGDIGAGHSVTALYELTLVGSKNKYNDELRYQKSQVNEEDFSDEIAYIKLRYKPADSDTSELIQSSIAKQQIKAFKEQDDDFKFATAVAGFAQLVSRNKFTQEITYDWLVATANEAKGDDSFGYRSEFIQLLRNAKTLSEDKSEAGTGK